MLNFHLKNILMSEKIIEVLSVMGLIRRSFEYLVPPTRLKQNPIFIIILNKLNDPKGPENIIGTMMTYEERFYGRHIAQHQLQWR